VGVSSRSLERGRGSGPNMAALTVHPVKYILVPSHLLNTSSIQFVLLLPSKPS
jgi:hypothetical protein